MQVSISLYNSSESRDFTLDSPDYNEGIKRDIIALFFDLLKRNIDDYDICDEKDEIICYGDPFVCDSYSVKLTKKILALEKLKELNIEPKLSNVRAFTREKEYICRLMIGARIGTFDNYIYNLILGEFKLILMALKEKVIGINYKDDMNRTIMHYVVSNFSVNEELVKKFLEFGPELNLVDKEGFTPIMNVKNKKIAELLIHNGAIFYNKLNGSPIIYKLLKFGDVTSLNILIQLGLEVDIDNIEKCIDNCNLSLNIFLLLFNHAIKCGYGKEIICKKRVKKLIDSIGGRRQEYYIDMTLRDIVEKLENYY